MNILKKTAFATALAATALTSAAPAMARDYHHGGDKTGTAIAVGVVGLALGALIASSVNKSDRHYRDGRYYDRDGRYYDGNAYYYGDYRDGRRYERDGRDYQRRGYRGY